jgi:hypothetical protein
MRTETVHIMPARAKGRWIVKKSSASEPAIFATRKEASAEAKRLMKGKRGQVVVLTRNGKIVAGESHGLPKIQHPAARSEDREQGH